MKPLAISKNALTIFRLVHYHQGELKNQFLLDKKKLLVGRAEHCDIVIDNPHISHYHAFIIMDEEGGKVIDLGSDNGVYINGQRTSQSYFSGGDKIHFGTTELSIEESTYDQPLQFIDQDKGKVEKVAEDYITELPDELPPHPGLVVIDGEYCDIKFDESWYTTSSTIHAFENIIDTEEFIDVVENPEDEIKDIIKASDGKAIEVTVISMGTILSVDYIPLNKNKTTHLSATVKKRNTLLFEALESEDRLPFVKVSAEGVTLFEIPGLECSNISNNGTCPFQGNSQSTYRLDDLWMYKVGTLQIMIKTVDCPPHLKVSPFFQPDHRFRKEAGKVFGIVMGLMLLLLFVDITKPEPEKKIAVIYRKKATKTEKPSDKKSSSVAEKESKDQGIKKNNQSKKQPKMAKKTPKTPKKTQKVTKKKQVAKKSQTKPAPAPKVTKAPKVKAYKLKLNNKYSSLFKANKSLTNSNMKTRSATTGSAKGFAASNSAQGNFKSKVSGNVSTLGQDFSGNYDSSTGLKGVAGKKGINTAFSSAKTVVLGSMDPELLRRILREYIPQFQHCYQQELEINEAVKGVVDLKFRILGSGKVSKVGIKTKRSRFSKRGSGCMTRVLRSINFPRPKGGGVVDVRQPLNFFSEKGKL